MKVPTPEDIAAGGYLSVRANSSMSKDRREWKTEVFKRESDETYWWVRQGSHATDSTVLQVEPVIVDGALTYHELPSREAANRHE